MSDSSNTTSIAQPSPTLLANETVETGPPAITPGAVAGIGVGCAVAGAVIVIAGYFMFRKHRASSSWRAKPPTLPPHANQQPRKIIEELPQSIDHHELRSDIATLETSIKNYVSNFFHDNTVRNGSVDDAALASLTETNVTEAKKSWTDPLLDPRTRSSTIRTIVARTILSRSDPRGNPQNTLLPLNIALCYHDIITRRKSQRPTFLEDVWRGLTASLLTGNGPTVLISDMLVENVRQTSTSLLNTLKPFRNRIPSEKAQDLLESVILEGAILGFKIFSQVESIVAEWETDSAQPKVVFPGFRQYVNTGSRESEKAVQITVPKYA